MGRPRRHRHADLRRLRHLDTPAVIIRCTDDLYNGHWCPVCGMCKCYVKGQFGGKQWSKNSNGQCPLHGKHSHHGNSKLIHFNYSANGKGRPHAFADEWGDPVVGTKSY